MILNISYHTPELKEAIELAVGKPFTWIRRFKMKGIGSQRYQVVHASQSLKELFDRDGSLNVCNIELRQAGIILRFRSRQETYGWMVPYYLLTIFKTDDGLSLFGGSDQIKLIPAHNASLKDGFIRKLIQVKADQTQDLEIPGAQDV